MSANEQRRSSHSVARKIEANSWTEKGWKAPQLHASPDAHDLLDARAQWGSNRRAGGSDLFKIEDKMTARTATITAPAQADHGKPDSTHRRKHRPPKLSQRDA
eukprot:m.315874 g.315874  ORF g.315874 m.315874 type:complete len:103 (-) comp55454_c1_seq6:133-441(-)